ncbi:MAG: methyltransferase domain-containing protein [Planctomycetes bacterium]|nr:methyltransferase domain-containing protein [Planctomycetota bacterium]
MAMDPKRKAYWKEGYQDPAKVAEYDNIRFIGGRKRANNRLIWRAAEKELMRCAGGKMPSVVIDAPAGTGRFTGELQQAGCKLMNLDLSREMLGVLQKNHGNGWEVIGDLNQPPLTTVPDSAVLCLRLMQHLHSHERIEAMRGLRETSEWAVISFYPARHLKHLSRRVRKVLGLFKRDLHPTYSNQQIRDEAEKAGWEVVNLKAVAWRFSDNVMVTLRRKA